MEQITDCNGDIVDPLTILTMMETYLAVGDAGTKKYFLRRHQYLFKDTSIRYVQCNGCGVTFTVNSMKHYRILIDTESFYIPEEIIAIEGTIRPEWLQDKYKFHEYKSDQPKDYRKAVLDTLGIDLTKTREESHDGYDYGEKLIREAGKNNGKKYGKIEVDQEDDPCETES